MQYFVVYRSVSTGQWEGFVTTSMISARYHVEDTAREFFGCSYVFANRTQEVRDAMAALAYARKMLRGKPSLRRARVVHGDANVVVTRR